MALADMLVVVSCPAMTRRYTTLVISRIREDRLDVLVARDDPVVELGAVEHRLGAARLDPEGVRVAKIRVDERVEGATDARDRTAGGGGAWGGRVE
jgi:hypothetical protein